MCYKANDWVIVENWHPKYNNIPLQIKSILPYMDGGGAVSFKINFALAAHSKLIKRFATEEELFKLYINSNNINLIRDFLLEKYGDNLINKIKYLSELYGERCPYCKDSGSLNGTEQCQFCNMQSGSIYNIYNDLEGLINEKR